MSKEGTWSVDVGDCVELLKTLPDAIIDSIVTDPPAGIGFMGKTWDKTEDRRAFVTFIADVMRECLRVLKPGGHALVWALPRTSHWTTTGIEDAGFEIRDVITHHFGSGFPKSLNLGDGWGTALKPASEHWILARKPLIGTLAKNIAVHGTGGLNIDGTRIGYTSDEDKASATPQGRVTSGTGERIGAKPAVENGERQEFERPELKGRWPANLILSHGDDCVEGACGPGCPVAEMDAQSGTLKSGKDNVRRKPSESVAHGGDLGVGEQVAYGDTGGASRFFYQAKPPRKEKEAGLEAFPARSAGEATDREDGSDGLKSPRAGAGRTGGAKNFHPTVKSVNLMRWLCRLITPPEGIVLDPFTGSGSTGCAALAEGFYFVGYEQDPEYAEIARARIKHYEGT